MLNSEKKKKKIKKRKVWLLGLYLENWNKNYKNKFTLSSIEHAYNHNYAQILRKKAKDKVLIIFHLGDFSGNPAC